MAIAATTAGVGASVGTVALSENKYDATKVEGAKILMQWGAEKTFVLLGHSEEMARQMVAVFEMLWGWNFFVKKAMDK